MMKRALCLLITLVLLSASCALAEKQDITLTRSGDQMGAQMFAMDTFIQATVYGSALDADALLEIMRNVSRLEALLSTTSPDSEISAVNAAQGESIPVSADTLAVLKTVLEVSGETGGAFDVTAYPLVKAWGFTQDEFRVPDGEELESLLDRVDYNQIILSDEAISVPAQTEIDLGGIAKGYTGDVLTAALREKGVNSALLSLGGNIAVIGRKQDGSLWKIGVRDPLGSPDSIGYLQIEDANVITSGGYERYFVDEDGNVRWHIIDPKTGYPAQSGLISVTVVGKNGAKCDALSTALFVMGADKASAYLSAHPEFEAILIREDGSLLLTNGLKDRFTLMPGYQNRSVEWISR